ncbi:MAG: LCP family protein [Bacilli bacterium]|nr:LCP family protein [Bacilli bacterium]
MTEEKKPKGWLIYTIFFIISIITSVFAIYEILLLSSIENLIRYLVIAILIIIDLILLFRIKRFFKPKKVKRHILLMLFMLLYSIICLVIGLLISFVYKEVSSINKVYVTYTSNLITMASSNISDVSDVSDLKIGILSDKKSVEGYKIPMDIIKENKLEDENELVDYGDYTSMIVDLYSNDIDACFVSDSYVNIFSSISGYENIENETKIVISKSEKLKKADTSSTETASVGKEITEPFTILLMGIDSTDEVLEKNAVANGDTLILITFNPKTLNATMLSIPRDSYVPIACWANKDENKITHAAAYGNDCMIKTIENYFDTSIDYYAKINFKGLVKLVDSLGGVEVDVEQELCTDDSNRTGVVCIHPGLQTLNGEQALVYARNRKQLANGDFGRNYHQQVIVMALMNKVKEIKDATQFMDLLNTVSNSVDTNFTTKQILSFYNVAKDIIKKSMSSEEADIVNIERLYLAGNSQMIYDNRARMVLYEYVPNQNSRKDIIEAMKVNLGLLDHTDIKEFTFSINKTYEKEVIGYGPYKSTGTFSLIPDFTGDSKEAASATCSRIGLKCTFVGTSGYVVSQSHPASSRVDKAKNFTLTLSQNKKDTDDEKTDKKDKDKKESKDTKELDDDEKEDTIDNKENGNSNNTNSNSNTENTDNKNSEVDNDSSNEEPDE